MSVKEFLIHMLAITIGLLIAVGIEGLVELHHEHKLVERSSGDAARGDWPQLEDRLGCVAGHRVEKTAMADNIKLLTRITENPKDKMRSSGDPRWFQHCGIA